MLVINRIRHANIVHKKHNGFIQTFVYMHIYVLAFVAVIILHYDYVCDDIMHRIADGV